MPFPADFETYAGTRLFIKAGRPTDDTEAAFETFFGAGALEFTVTQVGAMEGRQSNTSELDVVSQGLVRRRVGNYQLIDSEWMVLEEGEDGGTDAYEAADDALRGRTVVSFAAVRQSGAVLYFTAQVMKFVENLGTSNDTVKGAFTLLRQSDTITV